MAREKKTGNSADLGGPRGLGTKLPFVVESRRRSQKERRNSESMNTVEFRHALLEIMGEKKHWADPAFPWMLENPAMAYHFRDEYRVFVKPFPQYLRNVLERLPKPKKSAEDKYASVRKDLKENILEEDEGRIAQGILEKKAGKKLPLRSHAELFLMIPHDPAFGFDTSDYDTYTPGPNAQKYMRFLEEATRSRDWEVGAAVATLFLEGNKHEKNVFHEELGFTPRRGDPLEKHALHVHSGVALESLGLVDVHHSLDDIDGEHRKAAWRILLEAVPSAKRAKVLGGMQEALVHWKAWRDEVATACGVERDREGNAVVPGSSV